MKPVLRVDPAHEDEPEYRAWVEMMRKCYDPMHPLYPLEGGVGIEVCERWWDYEKFLEDMGSMPR